MEPTIPVGSIIISFRGAFLFDEPQKGDVVIFDPVEGISSYPWIHRVIATSGEDFAPLERNGRKDAGAQISVVQNEKSIAIPKGYIYHSGDSADSYHGLANTDLIDGKLLFSFKLPWK